VCIIKLRDNNNYDSYFCELSEFVKRRIKKENRNKDLKKLECLENEYK